MNKAVKTIYIMALTLPSLLFSTPAICTNLTTAEQSIEHLTSFFATQTTQLRPSVLKLALKAFFNARQQGIESKPVLTVIDYSLPSTAKRMWVLDLDNKKVLFNNLVAHGKGSGTNYAKYFSDRGGSLQSSLGLFLTEDTYSGHDGYSLKIKGLEDGFNDKAEARKIVMHGAWYVNENYAAARGRLGLSWGCPAVDKKLAAPIINTIKNGSLMFAYYPDANWLQKSKFINYTV